MKIVSLLGTPHGLKGNTAALLRLVLEGAEELGASTEIIVLKGGNLLPCLGCDQCHVKGLCVQKDDFEPFKRKVMEADGIVLASPNYIFSVSAQMKAFMDRCCGVIHCMSFEGKYGASVVTSGGGDEEPIAEYMNHFLITTGAIPIGSALATMGLISGDAFPEEIEQQARDLGRRLVTAWQNKEIPPEVEAKRKVFADRMRALVDWRKDEWPYEHNYWAERRGLE